MLVSAHDGGVNHHVFVVVIAGQELENPLESTALGPSVEALIDDLPVTKALGQIAPRDAGAKPEENGFDEQTIVRRRTAHMAFAAWENVFDPIPLVVAQGISSHRSAPPQADLSRVRHLMIRESLAYPKHKGSASDSDPFSPQLNTGPSFLLVSRPHVFSALRPSIISRFDFRPHWASAGSHNIHM